jgi:hypothetical protein
MYCAACQSPVSPNQCSQCGLLYKEPIEKVAYDLQEIISGKLFNGLSLKSLSVHVTRF